MKTKYLLLITLTILLIGCVQAKTFTPKEGTFAYKEVEKIKINKIKFTIPTEYKIKHKTPTQIQFQHNKDKLKITVTNKGHIKKVKNNPSKNITSSKTMLGSVKGYLVDKNGKYTFSYKEKGKLITIKAKDMNLIIGTMGKD
ncbi:MAG: hypothetical protein E7Z80_03750 [Methanobrevibacter thaueri]|nr:hypothetical protein [Methanobrevibacter thaueri]